MSRLDTPAGVVDLDVLEANIARLQAYLDRHGIRNRPHIKTHKIPQIARMQVRAGACGITCQKVGEAEVMARAGVRDIFIPYNIVGEAKLERLTAMARRIPVQVTADSEATVRGLARAARRAGLVLPVLVEFESGLDRCGVQTPRQAAKLALAIARSRGLRFAGLMCYPTSDRTDPFARATRTLLRRRGLAVETVSGGGTKVAWQAHLHPEVNEHRAGMYVYGDRYTMESGAMTLGDCALKVLATVVSRPTATRGILDAGSKTLSSDLLGLDGHGLILEYPGARIPALSEEHGHADFSRCRRRPVVGERVTVIPNHCCVVSNLFDEIAGVRRGKVEVLWKVAARGKIR